MTQELSIPLPNSESRPGSESSTVISVSIADPFVLLRIMMEAFYYLLEVCFIIDDFKYLATCTVSINTPTAFESSKKMVPACTLYHDKGPEPWLCKASTDAWLSTGIGESIDGADGGPYDQGDIYCDICYESGALEILDVPNFNCVFSVEKFAPGRTHLVDAYTLESSKDSEKVINKDSEKVINKSSEELTGQGRKENVQNLKVVELAMQRCSGSQGFFLSESRPGWFIVFRERLRVHPQLCDGSIVASTVLHNASCNHGFINVTLQGILKICRMPPASNDDNYWPVQKIPLRGTPHQVTYFAERNLYPIIVSVP
ncbi:Cleavage and polyadenylation specificity factor subunit 1 [Theobroma cacao]|uniref:Cleavage and polyadenylation specificity factor subunit 1 n=1 Tax=Theobroma cacao TaxID=3641 RepID=A0A061EYZ0_THECC|nr:Cleavage and polyadenylation specificity factor subunit 1 [Theobroma cacao]